MPLDSIRALTDRQLAAWKSDDRLSAAQLYVISRADSLDVEVSRVGDSPTLSKHQVEALLTRAAVEERPGFEVDFAGHRGYAYALRQDEMLQGVWLIFPVDFTRVDWAGWTRESLRFSQELFALRQAGLGNPPTFRQLVEAFPVYEESGEPDPAPPLHWERSQSRAVVPVENELSACLLIDHLPIF